MDNLASSTHKQFTSLLDAVAANPSGLGPFIGNDRTLGPCVGDDGGGAPSAPSLTILGPSVGDDGQQGSDLRLKQDVRCVGTTVFGLPLYHFKYIGKPETYEGVMAHEVLQVMPDAVSRGEDGYYRVNYSALGTSMRRVS
jgi:hypothetical protein